MRQKCPPSCRKVTTLCSFNSCYSDLYIHDLPLMFSIHTSDGCLLFSLLNNDRIAKQVEEQMIKKFGNPVFCWVVEKWS